MAAAKTAFQEAVVDITEIKKALEKDIQAICDKLRAFMAAAEIIDELSPRSQDYIVSAGERLSALIFVAVLRSQVLFC